MHKMNQLIWAYDTALQAQILTSEKTVFECTDRLKR